MTRRPTANGARRPCSRRDRSGAVQAYRLGRERLHRPDALAPELAQLAAADGDFATALREWLPAIRRLPGYRMTAVSAVGQAPDSVRPVLLRQLEHETDFPARRLEADLRARWGDPRARWRRWSGHCRRIGARRSRRSAASSTSSGCGPGRDVRLATGRRAGADRRAQLAGGARPAPAGCRPRLHRGGRAGRRPPDAHRHRRRPDRAGRRRLGRNVDAGRRS